MFRDRTNLYISYRQSYAHHPQFSTSGIGGASSTGMFDIPDEQQHLMDDDNVEAMAIEMDTLPPKWLALSDEVDGLLSQIEEQTTKLDILHKKMALPGFDDRKEEEDEIEQLTFDITRDLHQCQSLIKQLQTQSSTGNYTDEEMRMADNMKISMATKVQAASTRFRKMQSNYLKSLKNEALIETDPNNNGSNWLAENEDNEMYAQEQLSQGQQQQQVYSNQINLQQREREITQIAQGILELSEIFKDLQTMVIDQGTVLDRIDYNIENTRVSVKQADKELVKATHYQKRTQKCKIILLLSLLVLGLLIILIIKPKKHGNSGNNNNSSNNNNSNNGNIDKPSEEAPAPAPAGSNQKSLNGEVGERGIYKRGRRPLRILGTDEDLILKMIL